MYLIIAAIVGGDNLFRNNIDLTAAGNRPSYDSLFSDKRKRELIIFQAIAPMESGIRSANGIHKQQQNTLKIFKKHRNIF